MPRLGFTPESAANFRANSGQDSSKNMDKLKTSERQSPQITTQEISKISTAQETGKATGIMGAPNPKIEIGTPTADSVQNFLNQERSEPISQPEAKTQAPQINEDGSIDAEYREIPDQQPQAQAKTVQTETEQVLETVDPRVATAREYFQRELKREDLSPEDRQAFEAVSQMPNEKILFMLEQAIALKKMREAEQAQARQEAEYALQNMEDSGQFTDAQIEAARPKLLEAIAEEDGPRTRSAIYEKALDFTAEIGFKGEKLIEWFIQASIKEMAGGR